MLANIAEIKTAPTAGAEPRELLALVSGTG
jgi:hypothetical protein